MIAFVRDCIKKIYVQKNIFWMKFLDSYDVRKRLRTKNEDLIFYLKIPKKAVCTVHQMCLTYDKSPHFTFTIEIKNNKARHKIWMVNTARWPQPVLIHKPRNSGHNPDWYGWTPWSNKIDAKHHQMAINVFVHKPQFIFPIYSEKATKIR